MSAYTPHDTPRSEAEILRQAEALRNETIHAFFSRMFSKRKSIDSGYPAHAAPAE